ncbi:putative leucine-rich repeat-containing protein DDB_G0290503 [Melitaea cinxia]|uniref:putative leucine-rich repeat-containing protein DDB_G0290503 n=1 Tax=Melitaea cinxia TaxID=113334 RepID=UPI001E273F4C|nr:putative leucine-rich repeat-containing protein DDB_G0290503 [Melitaea cinxia]
MACVDIRPTHVDSEMEEGEIVDEVDYLSDISSEEEFLLRQRLKVLENYNNALERKEAKKTSLSSGNKRGNNGTSYGFTEISSTEIDDNFLKTTFMISKEKKHIKAHNRQKRLKSDSGKTKEHRKKPYRSKKKIEIISESDASEFSDDEYKNKRRKLTDAVSLNIVKNDTSTLKDRLTKMLGLSKTENRKLELPNVVSECEKEPQDNQASKEKDSNTSKLNCKDEVRCIDEVSKEIQNENISNDNVNAGVVDKKEELNIKNSSENSDEDLELLRQHALKTKSVKTKNDQKTTNVKPENKTHALSEDEDSDTAELRMICLKSRLLKKAIELKQKQKLQKRLSSSNMHDFDICVPGNDIRADNNTDTESLDMEIGSDNEDKGKELVSDCTLKDNHHTVSGKLKTVSNDCLHREDELEEDEDLLRAKLLISLSRNLPNLVDKIKTLDSPLNKDETKEEKNKIPNQPSVVEEKKFIIQLGDSDSEAEHEATKNLTKMHIKLSEQAEFQQKLDLLLKSTWSEMEKTGLPDVVQKSAEKSPEKFVAKAVNHLPKSEQIEYKNLVKRMAELEKMKQARQNTIIMNNRANNLPEETLKPLNSSGMSNKLLSINKAEEKIALSRKRIAEESSKILKLKEEATKLSQRYKIVATELKNIATAITLNKKQQKAIQNGLNKIRNQHQMLLRSVPNKHSNLNLTLNRFVEKSIPSLQKENEPLNEDYKQRNVLTSFKVPIASNLNKEDQLSHRLSVEVDVTNNKKNVALPKGTQKNVVDLKTHSPKKNYSEERVNEKIESLAVNKELNTNPYTQKEENDRHKVKDDLHDYKSPLDALQCKNWEEDPNGVLCPFDFDGCCRDPDCKYLHLKIPTQE